MNPAVDHPRAHPQRGGQFLAAQQPAIRRSCGSAKASWTCSASRTSPSASPHATASTRGGRAGRATSVADPTPAGPPPGGAAWRRTRPFRLRRSRRPIRSLQSQGRNVLGATAEGPDPPEGPHRGRISSVAPSTFLLTPGSVGRNTVLPPASRSVHPMFLSFSKYSAPPWYSLGSVGRCPTAPLAHRPTVGPVIGPETGAVGRRPVRSRPRPRDILRSRGSWPGQTGPRPGVCNA
jgi:hypothetical protein